MTTKPKRKVTYSLPEELIDDIARVVRDGAAASYSAFVEEAVTEKIRAAREEALAAAFGEAAADPAFLADVEDTMDAFRHIDDEPVGEGK